MILQARDSWEIHNPVFQAIDPPGTRRYAMVEIALNLPLFLLEAVAPTRPDEVPVWQKFLLTNFEDVQAFLAANTLEDHSLNLLLPRYLSEAYEFTISTVTRIYTAAVPDGGRCNLFVCENGRRFLDASGRWDESSLTDEVLIYEKEKPVDPEWDEQP